MPDVSDAADPISAMDQFDPHGIGHYLSPAGLSLFFGAIMGALPVILGIIGGTLAIGWYSVALWESKTVQNYVANRKARALARQIAVLELKQSAIVGQLKQLGVLVHADTTVSHAEDGQAVKSTTSIETTTVQIQK